MNLESSQEHELPGSTTSAETGHNSVVQGNNIGEQLPTNVILDGNKEKTTYHALPDPTSLNGAGMTAIRQYRANGQLADLNRAVEYWQKALNLITDDLSEQLALLNNLGIGLSDRYAHTGKLIDLDAAITVIQQAVQATPDDSPDRPAFLNNLGVGLSDRYVHTGKLTDLETAIDAYQQAVRTTPADSPKRPGRLNNLGVGLNDRYARTGSLADLETAIDAYQQAVRTTLADSPDRPAFLNNLGNGLRDRYACTGNESDQDAAIDAYQQAVDSSPTGWPKRPDLLNNLGAELRNRYAHAGKLTDLDTAIKVIWQAIKAAPANAPNRSGYLSNLGNGLRDRYACLGNPADLDAVIIVYEQSIQTTPADSPKRSGRLNNLGIGLSDRYARTGSLADLETAIDAYREAIQTTSHNSPHLPILLNNLSTGMYERYVRTRDLADLDAIIKAIQQAIEITPVNSPSRPALLVNQGLGLLNRYARLRNPVDLKTAIDAYQEAVQTTSDDSPDRPGRLNNLGMGLHARYARVGNLADLDAAISAYQEAIQTSQAALPDWPDWWNNLGTGLNNRYTHTGNLTDLDAAINAYQQAVQFSSADLPHWPIHLHNLGTGLYDRYTHTGNLTDLDAAITTWEKYWSAPQLHFASLPATYQLGQQRQGVGVAVHLVTAYLERAKQHHTRSPSMLRRVLEITEGNKSRLLTQIVGRGPLVLPAGFSPEIAVQERQLLADLTALDVQELANYGSFASSQGETRHLLRLQQRQAILRELEDLWTRIARIGPEGTEYVALRRGAALTWQEFVRLTKELGPSTALLSFFVTTDRVLLFLLRAGWRAPRMVEVPLNQNDWVDLWERLFREIHLPRLHRSETWDQSLRPLFTKAQHHLEGVEQLILAPHSIGHLLPWSVLAEHAGWQTSTKQPLPLITLPALSILPRLRQRPHVSPGPALVVGNPTNPNYHHLSSAEAEAKEVAKLFGTDPLLGVDATKSKVLTHFSDATLIHLATHAYFDANNPLESGIVLADGVLTAREVLQYRLQADLLVLSACESGQIGSLGGEELAGLSQAFLQAGVRSLIISLWQVNDQATTELILAFYAARQAGADKALALRQAMTHIQQDLRWTHTHYWGAFVLMGDWD